MDFIHRFGESPKLRKLFPALLSCEKLSKLFSRRVFLFFAGNRRERRRRRRLAGRKRRRNYSLGLRFISFLRKWFSRKKGFFSDEKVHCNYEGDFFSHTVLLQFCSSIVATTGYAPQKNDRKRKREEIDKKWRHGLIFRLRTSRFFSSRNTFRGEGGVSDRSGAVARRSRQIAFLSLSFFRKKAIFPDIVLSR